MIGRTISHYQILEKLGEGGMGVVYKARDTHLDRFVAVKVLPPERVADPERKRRFVQEAKAASALNHPNIITIHDIDSIDGIEFISMEYVDGKTLDDKIPRHGMRLGEALKCAVQIADALAAAHTIGVVHRDLKPGNVMVTEKGQVKVLDFGLAKLTEPAESGEEASTRTLRPATEEGQILGTVSYMSPEQAEGKKIDARSDIFSFGSVLYEMVTGRKAFLGDTRASTQAAVLKEEPKPASQIAPGLPKEAERVIRRCLRKEPEHRFQHMDDLKVALEELKEESDSGTLESVAARRPKRRWMWVTAAGAALLLAAVLVWQLREASPPGDLQPVALTAYPGVEQYPSFSPDGNRIAFAWNSEKEDNYDIYVKQIGSTGPPMRLTTDPAAESYPAWSPDDRWIAFRRQQQGNAAVMLMPPLGGPERKITEMLGVAGLCWTPDSKWLVLSGRNSPEEGASIWAVSLETGERRRLTTAKATEGVYVGHFLPSLSPDGSALAFTWQVRDYVGQIYVLRLTRDLRPDGEPVRVTDERYANLYGIAWTANGGEIVYSAGGSEAGSLWRVPVSGGQTPRRLSYASPNALFPAIARTPPRLVYTWRIFNKNLWRLDTRTGERKMLIGSTYYSQIPQYSPDGRKIAFDSNRSGNAEIWTCDADGLNCQQLTSFGGPLCGTARWSPDGRWLALDSRAEGQPEIYVMAADGGTPHRMTDHPANDSVPSWSRDGRWIYFNSDRSGRVEIWKIPSGGGEAVQVTRSGGLVALESPDGNIYYVKASGGRPALFRMPVGGSEEKQVLPAIASGWQFCVSAKGVYFRPDGRTIQFLDTATGKVSTLATLDRPGGPGLCVSPDEAYVVWAQVDRNTTDLMLVEGFR